MRTLATITMLAGCGSGLECGPGTIERDGVCVVAVVGDDDDDAVAGDDDDDVPLSGPQAVVTPALYDFGPVGVGCPATTTVAVANGGDEDLVVFSLLYTTAGTTFAVDDAALPALPLTVAPGDAFDVRIDALPGAPGPDAGRIAVGTNDPDGVIYADQAIEGIWGTATESFEVTTSQIDVLLLIDHSCSMEDNNRPEVEAGIPALVDALDLVGDWQIAQVTLDSGCMNGGLVGPTTPNGRELLVDHAWDASPLGGGNYLTEALLELGSIALSKTDPGECNEGFLRPGAPLYVLIVSDEREQSGMPPAVHVADYQTYDPGVVVSVVVDENLNCGDGSGGTGYIEAANVTGGVVMDICGSWGADMDDLIAGAPVAEQRVFTLTAPATDAPLEVLVDGVATSDFTWDAATNQLSVGGDLPDGTTIEVTYPVAATCSP